jgi:hypothetical protein
MADVDDKMMLDSHSPVDRVDGDFFNDFGAGAYTRPLLSSST